MSVNFYIGFFIVLLAILMHGVYKHRKEGQKKSVQL